MAMAITIAANALALALATCSDDGTGDHFDLRELSKFVEWIAKHHPGYSATYSNGVLCWSSKGTRRQLVFAANANIDTFS